MSLFFKVLRKNVEHLFTKIINNFLLKNIFVIRYTTHKNDTYLMIVCAVWFCSAGITETYLMMPAKSISLLFRNQVTRCLQLLEELFIRDTWCLLHCASTSEFSATYAFIRVSCYSDKMWWNLRRTSFLFFLVSLTSPAIRAVP